MNIVFVFVLLDEKAYPPFGVWSIIDLKYLNSKFLSFRIFLDLAYVQTTPALQNVSVR